jgi:hypothetical protein
MTVTLNLNPELEAGLFAPSAGQRHDRGRISPFRDRERCAPGWAAYTVRLRNERRSLRSGLLATVLPLPLSDYAVSRDAMYEGRDH